MRTGCGMICVICTSRLDFFRLLADFRPGWGAVGGKGVPKGEAGGVGGGEFEGHFEAFEGVGLVAELGVFEGQNEQGVGGGSGYFAAFFQGLDVFG